MHALDWARAEREAALARLTEFLRIPSVSTDPARAADVARAADWLAERLRAAGATTVELHRTARHPIVYAECLAAPGAPTLLVYGHYDVQPPEPLELWTSPPFEPTLREGAIYARGASDDKGQTLAHVEALAAFTGVGESPPVNLKLVIEGEEEIGSPNLEPWIRAHAGRLAADAAVISDTAMIAPGQPSLVVGLRGLAYFEILAQGAPRDLHSGQFGGAVWNPIHVLARVIAGLHDAEGRITIPGFYDRVRPLSEAERAELAALPFDLAAFRRATGEAGGFGEAGYSIVERLGARPTLDANGIWGGFTGAGAKTVLPNEARAKVSMRLVTDQDPDEIEALFRAHLGRLAPPGVTLELAGLHHGRPARIAREAPALQAAVAALDQIWGQPPVFSLEGGTIPVVALLGEVLGLAPVMLGFGLPDDNLHAPNEKFAVEHFHKGIETVIAFYAQLAGMPA